MYGCARPLLIRALDCQNLNTMSLEKKVEEGGFYYIYSINHDAAKNSLTTEFMTVPEEMSPAKRFLVFENIEDYSEEVDEDTAIEEAADGVIDSLIGVSEYLHEGRLRYELVTEDRVFNFHTKTIPRIEGVLGCNLTTHSTRAELAQLLNWMLSSAALIQALGLN